MISFFTRTAMRVTEATEGTGEGSFDMPRSANVMHPCTEGLFREGVGWALNGNPWQIPTLFFANAQAILRDKMIYGFDLRDSA